MLRAKSSNGVIILGLDNEDIKLLRGGYPLLAEAKEMGCENEIVVMYGANFAHIKAVLETASGMPVKSADGPENAPAQQYLFEPDTDEPPFEESETLPA